MKWYQWCLLFCGTVQNGTLDYVKYLFYRTAQKQAKTTSTLELLLWIGFRLFQVNTTVL